MADFNIFGGRRILLVEDDYFLVYDLIQQLEANGAEIVGPIATIDEAIDRLRSLDRLDGAVLDINLQGQHVFPLADGLAERTIPFVFATAYEATIVPPRFAHVPVLGKPVAIDEIAEALLPDGVTVPVRVPALETWPG